MDFIISLPVSREYSKIFVIIDRLLKYGYFIPLKIVFTSGTVIDGFINYVVKLYGIPKKNITSYCDKVFTSQF